MTLDLLGLATSVPESSIEQDDASATAWTLIFGDGLKMKVLSKLFQRAQDGRRDSVLLESNNVQPASQSF